jgi:hypothetical protein
LLVEAERKRRTSEPGIPQMSQVRLRGQAERPHRSAHRIPDASDSLGDAIPDQQLAFAHSAAT